MWLDCFMTKVKICGITNLEDAELSVKFGADALGFNFYQKSPRYITTEKTIEIIEKLPENVLKVGVFVNESLEKIAETAKIAKLNALQLHGEETPEFAKELKLKTNLEIIKAFRVSPTFQPEDVLQYEVDAILLDAYNPKEHGGTGETFDWEIAKKVQEIFPKTYLAGGLRHENIGIAIGDVKPFAVDACSGIESQKGKKDKIKLINFVTKAKKRFKESNSNPSLYDFLDAVHQRPQVYFGEKSLTKLHFFLWGFSTAVGFTKANFDTGNIFTDRFTEFVGNFFDDKIPPSISNTFYILRKFDGDEEKAIDAFFAILEEFKLEKETDSTLQPNRS